MKFSEKRIFRLAIVCLMSVLMAHTPHVAFAGSHLISTSEAIQSFSRTDLIQVLEKQIQSAEVKALFEKNGVSEKEVNSRIASLTDKELSDLNQQVSQARAGGDILVTILLVVLIIFLIKRI